MSQNGVDTENHGERLARIEERLSAITVAMDDIKLHYFAQVSANTTAIGQIHGALAGIKWIGGIIAAIVGLLSITAFFHK